MFKKLIAFLKRLFYNKKQVKEELLMSKKKEEGPLKSEPLAFTEPGEEVVVEIPKVSEVKLDHSAYSIAKNPKTGFWHVVKVPYNVDGTSGKAEFMGNGEDRANTIFRFKVTVGDDLMAFEK